MKDFRFKESSLKKVIFYQVLILILIGGIWTLEQLTLLPEFLINNGLALHCILTGVLGGILYCLRAVYVNWCTSSNWESRWELWYYLRPITSGLSGLVAFIFLKAGIIVLAAEQTNNNAGEYGFLAFAFIAGLNVDNFVNKLENTAKAVFGIEKSRTAKNSDKNK